MRSQTKYVPSAHRHERDVQEQFCRIRATTFFIGSAAITLFFTLAVFARTPGTAADNRPAGERRYDADAHPLNCKFRWSSAYCFMPFPDPRSCPFGLWSTILVAAIGTAAISIIRGRCRRHRTVLASLFSDASSGAGRDR